MYPIKSGLIDKEVKGNSIFSVKNGLSEKEEIGNFMFSTKNNLPEKVRIQVDSILQDRLADSIDLNLQAKQAHWNVKGPNFIALHELFDKVAEAAEGYSDLLAERIVQFGGIALGTLNPVVKKSSLPIYPVTFISGTEHVAALSHALATFGELIRKSIEQANEMKDAGTVDILTEISRGADKYLWFVEAHGQALH